LRTSSLMWSLSLFPANNNEYNSYRCRGLHDVSLIGDAGSMRCFCIATIL
jgi:hypothetical protein